MIKAEELTKTFGDFTAVNAISFDVPKGSLAAFLGPNGAGKTTTIRMLTTLLAPTKGSITINGHSHEAINDVRRSFGIVFQDPSLDDELTAEENLMFHAALYKLPKEKARARIDELLAFVELTDRRKAIVKSFSGGMKRRLEIARALMHEPAILFLDEPTAGLDPQTRNRMWDYLRKLKDDHGLTVLFTTHYMEEAEKAADLVYIIDHGNIVTTGTVDAIKQAANANSLEEAFLSLTGNSIRADAGDAKDALRSQAKMWGRR